MPEGVTDTFTYKVDLDTQGLAAQLASVRDVVGRGMQQAAGAVTTGLEVVGGATNRITSDIMAGQQMIAAAMPAQFAPGLSPMGIAGTTLANVPGMPQTFGQELMATLGISRAPVGVFPDQFQAIARQRLNERVQAGAMGVATGVVSVGTSMAGMWAGGALLGAPIAAGLGAAGLGAVIGTAALPGVGTFIGGMVGAVAGGVLADVAMAPIREQMDARMAERARVQQIFGWNQFSSDQRASMADFTRQQSVTSLFSPEGFNTVLPAATMAGIFQGVGRGDVGGFRTRFNEAQKFFTEGQFALQLAGSPEDIMRQGQLAGGLRRMGMRDTGRQMSFFRQANVLAQQMREMGEFVDPTQNIEQAMQVGQAAFQMGVSPQRAMQTFMNQSAITNRLIADKSLSDDDLALLGGTPGEAAQRLTMSVMATQRQPVFKAMAMAFGQVDPSGRAGVDQAALDSIGAGRMSFSALSERMSQQLGTGAGGTTKMLTLMANQGKLQSDMMVNQRQLVNSMSEDLLKQAGMEVTEGTRMFVMQRAFGVGEAESRALVRGIPIEEAAKKDAQKREMDLDRDIKGAISTAQTGLAREVTQFTRGVKEALVDIIDPWTRALADKLVPPLEGVRDRLESIDKKIGPAMRSNSPISAGPIEFGASHDQWMMPADPMSMQGFRSALESRKFPMALVSAQVKPLPMHDITRLMSVQETMAG